MKIIAHTYRQFLQASLFLAFLFVFENGMADDSQTLINKSVQTLGTYAGDAAPGIAYNSTKNEYLVVYTYFDANCTTNQELKAQLINALTGEKSGTEVTLTSSDQPCSAHTIFDPKIVFNELENEYLVIFKSTTALGAQIKFLTLNASTLQVSTNPTILDEDEIADPFKNCTLALDNNSNTYAIGFHKENALSESSLTMKFVNGFSKSILAYSTILDKSDFVAENKGVFGGQLLFNNYNILLVFEAKFTSGSEIHGVFINTQSGEFIDDIFQISPDGSGSTNYMNPAIAFNENSNEILTVYEEARVIGSIYALNYKIHGQRINSSTGELLTPTNIALTELPTTPFTEDTKLPSVCFSEISQEYLISFYGIRYAAGSDMYNIYLQRVNASNIISINPSSTQVTLMAGTQVVENNFLRSLPLSFNNTNNQYLLGWNTETNNNVQSQVWRYDNNSPKDLSISNTVQNENEAIGFLFSTFSATDPDPEDSSPSFTLVSGDGSEDNSFFSIHQNELKIAKNLNYEEASTRNIRVRATDSHGKYIENTFSLTINDINEKPFNLSLTQPLSVKENLTPGSFTTLISVDDPDSEDAHTFILVAGDSADNNSNFDIEAGSNILSLTQSLNFEDTSKQYIRIKATDDDGLLVEKAFVIDVSDVNEDPTDIVLTPTTIPENDTQSFARIDVIDPDNISNFIISKTSGEGDDDNALFDLIDNKLKPFAPLNFEKKNSYNVRLKAAEGESVIVENFTIMVTDVNDSPDSITLTKKQIVDGMGLGYTIGNFITYDQDESDNHNLELIEGTELFFIDNLGYLITKASLVFNHNEPTANLFPIRVRSTDNGDLSVVESFTIEVVKVIDEEKPRILDFELNPSLITENTDSVVVSIKATDNEQLHLVEFFYKPIRSQGDYMSLETIQLEKEGDRLYIVKASINTSVADELGLEYYFKVTDVALNVDSTEIGYLYNHFNIKSFTPVNQVYSGSIDSYKIISNPYTIENNKASKIFADYPSSDQDTWRLFEYTANRTVEIGNQTSSLIRQGHGYWFNKNDDVDQIIQFENTHVPENNWNNLYEMQLDKGWNMIGNPYPFGLNWNDILTYNGLLNNEIVLYTFNRMYSESNILKEYEGGFVFTNEQTTLKIPLHVNQTSGGRITKNKEFENGWFVNFTLDDGQLKNELAGIGMHELASVSFDNFDRPLLPGFINQAEIYVSHPEHFAEAFARDIVELKDNYIWEFVASTGHTNKNVILSWNADDIKKSSHQLMLYDVLHDQFIDISREDEYSFTIDQPTTFKAIYGDEAFIKDALGKIKTEALRPYPNPFDDMVTIPINLPYSTNGYNIECSIYNLMGEKVSGRKSENIKYGLYQLDWNEDQNIKLKQGIYIYSIIVKNGFLTNNFHGRIVKN